MALLAEQLVDEWLNRLGFFTVRGIKEGVNEIDLLAIRPNEQGIGLDAWHVEVQISFNPTAYISQLSDAQMKELGARSRSSAKQRPLDMLEGSVADWVDKKFKQKKKIGTREKRWPGQQWHFVLVHARTKHAEELELIRKNGVQLIPFIDVLSALADGTDMRGQTGTDIVDIIGYYTKERALK